MLSGAALSGRPVVQRTTDIAPPREPVGQNSTTAALIVAEPVHSSASSDMRGLMAALADEPDTAE
jgi:hypothetical protein